MRHLKKIMIKISYICYRTGVETGYGHATTIQNIQEIAKFLGQPVQF